MRARNIKPSIFKNEHLAVADPLHTLIFEGLWCLADREGRLEDRPAKIHMEINPGRSFDRTEESLKWLSDHDFIVRYCLQGRKFIWIPKFTEHQKPHQNEKASTIPPYEGEPRQQVDRVISASEVHQGAKHLALNPSSLNPDSLIQDRVVTRASASEPELIAEPEPSLDPAPAGVSPEGKLAMPLIEAGVSVASHHPTLVAWVRDGITVQRALEAVAIARQAKPAPQRIAANYLDRILRDAPRGPPLKQQTRFDRLTANLEKEDQGFG